MFMSVQWLRKILLFSIFICVSVISIKSQSQRSDTASISTLSTQDRFMIELKACQQTHAANPGKCSLFGKIKIVKSFPDVKVKVVDSFPDLKVQVVNSFPDKPGKWQIVDSFPDYKVQYVDSFPDVKVKFVKSFPGCN
jgi:hypothetical protein